MDNNAYWDRKYITHGTTSNPVNDSKYNDYYNENKHWNE
jgi:hypothetical protein